MKKIVSKGYLKSIKRQAQSPTDWGQSSGSDFQDQSSMMSDLSQNTDPSQNTGNKELKYNGFTISRNPHSFGPHDGWAYVADDFDGAPDMTGDIQPKDKRQGTASSIEECMSEIDELSSGGQF